MLWRTGFFCRAHISFSAAELTTQLATRQNAGVTLGELEGGAEIPCRTLIRCYASGTKTPRCWMTRRRTTRCPRPCYHRKKRVLNCPDFTLRAGAPDGGTAPRGRTAVLCSTMPPTTPPTVCVCCPVVSGPAFKRGGLHLCKFMERSPACSYERGASCENRGHLAAERCGYTKKCRPNREGIGGRTWAPRWQKKGGKQKRGYGVAHVSS